MFCQRQLCWLKSGHIFLWLQKLSMPASISSSTKGQKSPVDVQPASQRNQPLSKTIGPGSGLQQMATFQNMPQPNLAEFKDKCKVSEMDSQLEVPVREFCKAVASLSIGDDKLEVRIYSLGMSPLDWNCQGVVNTFYYKLLLNKNSLKK